MPVAPKLRVLDGGTVPDGRVISDPWEFQSSCVEAFVASWRARGFSPVTIDNDTGRLERTLAALGRPAWKVTRSAPRPVAVSRESVRTGREACTTGPPGLRLPRRFGVVARGLTRPSRRWR